MALFLAFSIPLLILCVAGNYLKRERGNPVYLRHGLHGFVFAVPVLIINQIVMKPFPVSFLFSDIFFHTLIYGTFQLFLFALFVYHIPCGFRLERREEKYMASREWQTFLFFGAFYAAASLLDSVVWFGDYHASVLFYVPLSRIGVLFSTVVIFAYMKHETGGKYVLLYAATLLVPLISTFGYSFFYLGRYGLGIPILVLVTGGPFAMFHIWMNNEYQSGMKRERIPLQAL